MNRARPGQTLLAAIATLVAAWPITTLFQGRSWVLGAISLVLLAALFGMAARAAGASPLVTLSVQLIGVVTVAVVTRLPDHLDTSLPGALRDLGIDANRTVTTFAAPAPTTAGIVFFVALIVAGLAISVDFLAVTCRSPALAGVPLFVEFIISAANSGGALHPKFFLLAAAAWLVMLYGASARAARDWSGRRVNPSGHYRAASSLGEHGFGFAARAAGALALVLALLLAGTLPASSQKFLGDGLARGQGGGSGTVGFSDNLDLSRNLTSQDSSPVLTFRTTDPDPAPLRALIADDYVRDRWEPNRVRTPLRGADGSRLERAASNPRPVSANRYRISISQNSMKPPYVVGPTQIGTADFQGARWSYDPKSSQPSTKKLTTTYSLDYLSPKATARPSNQRLDPAQYRSDLAVDPTSRTAIAALVQQAAPRGSAFNRAIAIQTYLRSGGNFVYSLTLAPTRKNAAGRRLDPISNFLATKQGYCMQFATAMTMAARSIGVPARLGVGFLPGSAGPDGVYTVKQSDAHAWPELFFPGMGWTRFEPTPGSRAGAAPGYATPKVTTPTAPEPRANALPRPKNAPSTAAPVTPTSPTGTDPTSNGSVPGWLTAVLWALAALTVLLVAFSILPLLARRAGRPLRTDDPAAVQAQWDNLVMRMQDLGIEPPPPVSPRSQEDYYQLRLSVDQEGRHALHEVVMVMERARYTQTSGSALDMTAPADSLVARVRATRSLRCRAGAALFPRSGRQRLRSLLLRGYPGRKRH